MNKVSNINLFELYDQLNKQYFRFSLPPSNKITLVWSNRLTRVAGKCQRRKGDVTIKLSVPYHEKFPEEVELTLVHEMIHIRENGHGYGFKRELERINRLGLPVRLHSLERATPKVYKWEYTCSNPNCDNHFRKARALTKNRVCGKCYSKFIKKPITIAKIA